jgi:chromosome segregation ATPase
MGEHISRVEQEKESIETVEGEITTLIETIQDKASVKSKAEKASSLKHELESTIRTYNKELAFYHDHDNCPTCKQGIEHSFKENVVTEKSKKVSEIEAALVELSEKVKGYEARIEEISVIEDTIRDKNLTISEHRVHIRMSKTALKEYKSELDKAEKEVEEVDGSKLQAAKETLGVYQTDRAEMLDERDTLNVVSTILKDGGIKAKIIKQYIPVMNKLINKYLGAFDLFVDFQLDENFNEIIKSRFRDTFSYSSFSEGEKLRISLSIMLAWRSVAKLRNSVTTNLLILDETLDGAMDNVGVENLIETLNNLNKDDNIFVISHRGDQFAEKFTSHVRFQKVKNFSEIAA